MSKSVKLDEFIITTKNIYNDIVVLYKNISIAIGKAKEVAEQLYKVLNELRADSLLNYLQELADVCTLVFKNKKFGDEVKNLLQKSSIDIADIRVQGSTLRVKKVSEIKDIDIAIFLNEVDFQKVVLRNRTIFSENPKRYKRLSKKSEKELEKGKISSFSFPNIENNTFDFIKYKTFKNNKPIQMSIIKQGSEIDTPPYLKIK